MISLEKRIVSIVTLGEVLTSKVERHISGHKNDLSEIIIRAKAENPWYTEESILKALQRWIIALKQVSVTRWIEPYETDLEKVRKDLNVAVINAGNIPFVGFHDLLSVLLSGYNYIGKNATGDSILLTYIASILSAIEPGYVQKIRFVPRLVEIDAVIATGNNNSARYFEYYFGKYPHVIRKNRNGAGVLTGNETVNELHALGEDIFTFFGLGCRNVSKLYVPKGYDFTKLFEVIEDFHAIAFHNKYMNNFEYNNSVFLLKKIPFLQNGFLIIRKENQIPSPIAVLHYEEYNNTTELEENMVEKINMFQCIAAPGNIFTNNVELQKIKVGFGETQSPALWDYADGVDTLKFLCQL